MGNLIYEDLTYKIRKSLFNVYNELGPGFREETYKQAVMIDFKNEGIPFVAKRFTTYVIWVRKWISIE